MGVACRSRAGLLVDSWPADALTDRRRGHQERARSRRLSPPTARSVRASCDGGGSAGWQHRNSRVSVSSRSSSPAVVSRRATRPATAAPSSRCRRAPRRCALVHEPPLATVSSQPRAGSRGHRWPGHWMRRGEQRLLDGVFARGRSGRDGGRACRGPAAQARAAGARRTSPRRSHVGWRVPDAATIRTAPCGRGDQVGLRDLERARLARHVHDPVEPACSFVSAYGPSVTTGTPSGARTVLARA